MDQEIPPDTFSSKIHIEGTESKRILSFYNKGGFIR